MWPGPSPIDSSDEEAQRFFTPLSSWLIGPKAVKRSLTKNRLKLRYVHNCEVKLTVNIIIEIVLIILLRILYYCT